MVVEDTFGIQIEDSEAEKLLTPRQLIHSAMRKVASTRSGICLIGYERLLHRVSEGDDHGWRACAMDNHPDGVSTYVCCIGQPCPN
jgi:hypothetical protein